MDKLDTIIKALKVILGQNQLEASADTILDCAVRLHITDKINANKGPAHEIVNGVTITRDALATDKQIATLKKLGVQFNENITKSEASQLISKKIESFS